MQTEVATDDTQDSKELEARKRSAQKWRKRFFWLPVVLPILMVLGYILAVLAEPPYFPRSSVEFVSAIMFLVMGSVVILPPMFFLALLVGTHFIYSRKRLFFTVIGVAIGLSIVNGLFWFMCGGMVARWTDDPPGGEQAFAALYMLATAAALIAAVIGGVAGLLYGWFRKPHG